MFQNHLAHRYAFNTFANRADLDQAALVRAARSGSTMFAHGNIIRYDPTPVGLTSNLFVLCLCVCLFVWCLTTHQRCGSIASDGIRLNMI